MKCLDIEVSKLGPIDHATFTSSNMNVLCGRNNSGKSFLLHMIFCFLNKWRYRIQRVPRKDHIDQLLKNGAIEFDIKEYFDDLNQWIAKSMPSFVSFLPGAMRKSKENFQDTIISITIDREFLASNAQERIVRDEMKILPSCTLRIRKDFGSTMAKVKIENGGKEFPDSNVVGKSLSVALGVLVVDLLPRATLLTAERVGTQMYGVDIYAYNMRQSQDEFNADRNKGSAAGTVLQRYPLSAISEMEMLLDAKRLPADAPISMAGFEPYEEVRRDFEMNVAGGRYEAEADGQFFAPADDLGHRRFHVEETSTSVKSLMFLDYFLKHQLYPGALLMIDEPEMNLHLEKQRALVRFLARMVRTTGIGVALTTHSDTIIREMNTLIALGNMGEHSLSVMTEFGYNDNEKLPDQFVACGVVGNGTIEQCKPYRGGFRVPSFDSTLTDITRVQTAIVQTWTTEGGLSND